MSSDERKKTADDYFDTHILPLLEEERSLKERFKAIQDERLKHHSEHLRLTRLWILSQG